jgi:hypothetical protein
MAFADWRLRITDSPNAACGLRVADWARSGAHLAAAAIVALTLTPTRAWSQQPAQDTTQQGPRAASLLLELDGKPLTDWVVLRETDSLVLTVRARDSLGNTVPIWGFEAQVWDQGVLWLVGTEVQSSQAVVRLAPRRRGQTTITLRCSGVRSWVLAEYRGAEVAVSPGQPEAPQGPVKRQGPGWSAWTVGGRADLGFYSYSFNHDTVFTGRAGVLGELFVGREWSSGLTLVGGVTGGLVQADSFSTSVTVTVVQLYARADYAFMRPNKVRPVISFGGGMYRARTGAGSAGIWNASLYWMAGVGVDATLAPKVTGEARLMYNDLWEATSPSVNGHVGRLVMLGVGARLQLR